MKMSPYSLSSEVMLVSVMFLLLGYWSLFPLIHNIVLYAVTANISHFLQISELPV